MRGFARGGALGAVVLAVVMVVSPMAAASAVPGSAVAAGGADVVDRPVSSTGSAASGAPGDRRGPAAVGAATNGSFDTGPVDEAKLSPAVRLQLARAHDDASAEGDGGAAAGDLIPVIVVMREQPDDRLDLGRLSGASGRQTMIQFARERQARTLAYLGEQRKRGEAAEVRSFWLRNAIAVEASPETIVALTRGPDVERIIYDQEVSILDDGGNSSIDRLVDRLSQFGNVSARPQGLARASTGERVWSIEYIGADDVQERGYAGEGVNVSVVDTGIDAMHPALQGQVTRWKDFTAENCSDPCDPHGHGTHVAGTIAGRPDARYAVGTAPGADLFGARALDENGGGRLSDVLAAFEWSANNSADVVSASLGMDPITELFTGTVDDVQPGTNGTSSFPVLPNGSSTAVGENLSVSVDGFEPAYVFVLVVPTAENGTPIDGDERNMSRVMANLTVALEDPSGDPSLRGIEADWVYPDWPGGVPDVIGLWKFKPDTSRTLADGTWTLDVANDHPTNVSYEVQVLPVYPSNGSDEMARFVDNLATTQGVIPVIAAGNSGFFLGNRSLGSPGTASQAITVGATGRETNDVATFSSRGPVGYGADTRPGVDLIAPGTNVVSAIPPNSTIGDAEFIQDYSDAYVPLSGTSMATPHVSGTIALQLSADPTLTRAEVLAALRSTAQPVPLGENAVGAGALDSWAAVNSTVDLGARTPRTEAGVHELFAGVGGTGEIPWVDVDIDAVIDPAGDAGAAPDLWALTGGDIYDELEIGMHDSTPRNGSFELYLDVDRNDSTGDPGQRGAEFLVRANRTFSGGFYDVTLEELEYDAVNDTYVPTTNVSVCCSFGAQGNFVQLLSITFANRDRTDPFEWHVVSRTPGSPDFDVAPDTGQQPSPAVQNITALAVSWNATDGAPDAGEPIEMTVFDEVTDSVVANTTVVTDADGIARAEFPVTASDRGFGDDYRVEIEDRFGNRITQWYDFHGTCIQFCLVDTSGDGGDGDGDGGFEGEIGNFTVQERRYDVFANSTVGINIPIYEHRAGTLTPYEGNASLRLSMGDATRYRSDLTVEDGVLRTTLDLNTTTFDDDGFGAVFITVALVNDINTTFQTAFGGDISILAESDFVETTVGPVTTVTPRQTPVELSFQNVVYGDVGPGAPANVSVAHETEWITDRYVAAFFRDLPGRTAAKLRTLRRTALTRGRPTVELTRRDRAEIDEALRNLSRTQGTAVAVTSGTAEPTRRGIGTFAVSPPEDARYGFVAAEANATAANASFAYEGGSMVFVDGRVREFKRKHTEPAEESPVFLQVSGSWGFHRGGDFVVPNDTMTVEVALLDAETHDFVGGATVRLYATSGAVTTVTTSDAGYVTVEVPAPDLYWPTATSDQLEQQVVGIAEGYTTADGKAVTDDEFLVGTVDRIDEDGDAPTDTGVVAAPELSYAADTLDLTLEYLNRSDFTPANAVRTLMITSTPYYFAAQRDVNVSFVDPPAADTSVAYGFAEPFPTTEVRDYSTAVRTGDTEPFAFWVDSLTVRGIRVVVEAPATLAAGETATATITVLDRNGQPVPDATVVWKYFEGFPFFGDVLDAGMVSSHRTGSQLGGGTEVATTDASGQVAVGVTAPALEFEGDDALDLLYDVGVATDTVSYPFAEFGIIDVSEQPPANVTGRLFENASAGMTAATGPGPAAAGDVVVVERLDGSVEAETLTAGDGTFSLVVGNDTTYDLVYAQLDESAPTTTVGERDGSVDVWPIDRPSVSGDLALGNVTLPEGYPVNVTVVDDRGAPVAGAPVMLDVRNDATGADVESPWIPTMADGLLYPPNNSVPGFELRDNVTVTVEPPPGDERFVDRTYVRSLDVTGPEEVTVVLDTRFTDVTGRLFENDSDPAANDTVAVIDGVFVPPVRTNATGHFDATVPEDTETDLQYYQTHPTWFPNVSGTPPAGETPFVRDASVDLYALARVNTSGPLDTGSTTLPAGYVVNVTVVDETGTPVENASVTFEHHSPTGPAVAGIVFPDGTNADGMFEVDHPDVPPGFELAGTVTLEVAPPADDPRFVSQTYTRELSVTGDTNVTIALAEREAVPTVAIATANTTVNTTTGLPLTLSSAPSGLSGYEIQVTIANGTVAEFTGATYPASFDLTDTTIGTDNTTITVKAADLANNTGPGATNVTLATVRAKGLAVGTTNLSVSVVQLDDDAGDPVTPFQEDGRLDVTVLPPVCAAPPCATPTDPDGDGVYEDLDGNGRLGFNDVVVFFEHMHDPEIQDHAWAYDVNGNGRIDFDDIVSLFEEI